MKYILATVAVLFLACSPAAEDQRIIGVGPVYPWPLPIDDSPTVDVDADDAFWQCLDCFLWCEANSINVPLCVAGCEEQCAGVLEARAPLALDTIPFRPDGSLDFPAGPYPDEESCRTAYEPVCHYCTNWCLANASDPAACQQDCFAECIPALQFCEALSD